MERRAVIICAFALGLSLPGAALAQAAAPGATAPAAGTEGLPVDSEAPVFMLPVVAGSTAARFGPGKWTGSLAEEPKKLVIMSFFATYCEPCKKEIPVLVRLHQQYARDGLGIMMVSIDKGDEQRDELVRLARTHEVPFPVMHDRFQVVGRRYRAERLPYLLLIDGGGVMRRIHIGYTEAFQSELEAEVRELLGLAPLTPPVGEKPGTSKSTSKKSKASKPSARRNPKGGAGDD